MKKHAPLAERIRPTTLDGYVGQEHLVGEGKPLRKLLDKNLIPGSMIFWGPPGTGKTTLARIITKKIGAEYTELSAVNAGKADLVEVVKKARLFAQPIVLFLDEIHRFNKAQQDFLLPHVEQGTIRLIGATTENPSFEVNAALLSRSQVFVLQALSEKHVSELIQRAIDELDVHVDEQAINALTSVAGGDARAAMNILEFAAKSTDSTLTREDINEAANRPLHYDKDGEEHYNIISALHKSMRDSDADASVYWTMRMIEAGEDPKYIIRRMIRFASEDIGNADPQALALAISAKESVMFLGYPECNTALVQCAAYLANAPKSNASYVAVKKAQSVIKETGNLQVPKVIRNAATKLMKDHGYGKDYVYAHDDTEAASKQQHLPDEIQNERFYEEK